MFTLIHFDMGICFYLYELKIKKLKNFIYNIIVRGWHHQLAHLNIHKDWSRSVFRKKCEISKCHIFLISHLIFIIFSLFCRKKCILSFTIDSILEWISPLIPVQAVRIIILIIGSKLRLYGADGANHTRANRCALRKPISIYIIHRALRIKLNRKCYRDRLESCDPDAEFCDTTRSAFF